MRLEDRRSGYRVTVSDDGPGIPADAQRHIFDRSVRADAARGSDAQSPTAGAGLGLAIARWVAEAHGGTLSLLRSDAQGSVFVIELPAR